MAIRQGRSARLERPELTDSGHRATKPTPPQWTIGTSERPGDVNAWSKMVPGPKYALDTNTMRPRAPAFTMRTKPEIVVGGNVPSWTNSIPGPKYAYDTNSMRQRQPAYTMSKSGSVGSSPKSASSSPAHAAARLRLTDGFKLTKKNYAGPAWSVGNKLQSCVGGDDASWKKSIPGPYDFDPDVNRPSQPKYSIGKRLASEGDLAKDRSPGPMQYRGAASDAKKQALVDSTKKRDFSPGFGIGSRFEGRGYEMIHNGAWARYG